MGGILEQVAGFVEQVEGFGPALDGAGFASARTLGHQIGRQDAKQVVDQLLLPHGRAGL